MKTFSLRHLLFLFIYAAFACSIQFAFGQKKVASEWVKHVIASQINQDHGHSVNMGDYNGDGRIDVSIAWGQRSGGLPTDGIWWYECPVNPKTSTWTKRRITHPNNLVLWSMAHAVGDIDNDGDLDVIAIGFDRGDVQLALNPLKNGGDVNQPWPTYKILANSSRKRDGERCEIIDIDGDGYKDFVFPRGYGPRSAFILFNPNGNPTGKWIRKELGGIAGSDAHDIYVADIDNDGDPDVVSASGDMTTRGAIYWFEHPNGNPRNGSWTRHRVDNASWNYGGLNIEDVDSDGYKDILCNHAHHTPGACGLPNTYSVLWFKNPKGSGRWTEYGIGKQTYPHAASLIDVDGDGVNELWVPDASNKPGDCNYGQYSGGLVYFKKGADPTQPWEKYRVAKAPTVGRQGAVYDIDGDGDLDIAISSDHDGDHNISFVWWENRTDRSTPSPVITSPARSAIFTPRQGVNATGTGDIPVFKKHVIKPPRPTTKDNTVPNMVWVHDMDGDGQKDIIASHVGWGTIYGPPSDGAEHPYVAWYKGPSFTQEFIMIDKNMPGLNGNSRIYRFVMYDVDKDGKKDLIGQGYQPFHNGNKWYKCPDNPTRPWNEWHDYGVNLKNGHDIRLRDINGDGKMEVVLLDSHSGKMIVKQIPSGNAIHSPWPYHTVTGGDGMTHYISFFDINRDGYEDIVIGKEEDGGKGIKWYEHPGYDKALTQEWKKHFVVNANFTKAFARDLDEDGDIDYIGAGELDGANIGWYKKTSSGYTLYEFDKKDNNNDVNGGHNCELVDVDGDGDEDLITGGVDKRDGKQRFRWYEKRRVGTSVKWIEHVFGVTSAPGFTAYHGFYCGEMAWSDLDDDGDIDFVYSGVGGGFLGWFENKSGVWPIPTSTTTPATREKAGYHRKPNARVDDCRADTNA